MMWLIAAASSTTTTTNPPTTTTTLARKVVTRYVEQADGVDWVTIGATAAAALAAAFVGGWIPARSAKKQAIAAHERELRLTVFRDKLPAFNKQLTAVLDHLDPQPNPQTAPSLIDAFADAAFTAADIKALGSAIGGDDAEKTTELQKAVAEIAKPAHAIDELVSQAKDAGNTKAPSRVGSLAVEVMARMSDASVASGHLRDYLAERL